MANQFGSEPVHKANRQASWGWATPVFFEGWLNFYLGFAPISFRDLSLIEDSFFANKRGWTLPEAPPVLERLGIDPGIGSKLVQDFGRLFEVVPVPPRPRRKTKI